MGGRIWAPLQFGPSLLYFYWLHWNRNVDFYPFASYCKVFSISRISGFGGIFSVGSTDSYCSNLVDAVNISESEWSCKLILLHNFWTSKSLIHHKSLEKGHRILNILAVACIPVFMNVVYGWVCVCEKGIGDYLLITAFKVPPKAGFLPKQEIKIISTVYFSVFRSETICWL